MRPTSTSSNLAPPGSLTPLCGLERTPAANGPHALAFLEGSGCQCEPWCLQWLRALTQRQAGGSHPRAPPALLGATSPEVQLEQGLRPERPSRVLTQAGLPVWEWATFSFNSSFCVQISRKGFVPSKHLHCPNCRSAVSSGSDSLSTYTPQVQVQEKALRDLSQDGPHPQVQGHGERRGAGTPPSPEVTVRCGGARARPQADSLPSASADPPVSR